MATFIFYGNYRKSKVNQALPPSGYSPFRKPSGGLWASPLLKNGNSEWKEWCNGEHYNHHSLNSNKRFSVTPKPDAKIKMVILNSYDYVIEWEKLLPVYDAVYITGREYLSTNGYDVRSLFVINIDKFTVKLYKNGGE